MGQHLALAGARAGLSFDAFYDAVTGPLWRCLSRARSGRFHGGRPCPQRLAPRRGVLFGGGGPDACPEDCVSAHDETILLLWADLGRARSRGDGREIDPVLYACGHAERRFRDANRTAGYHLYGNLTRIRRTVQQSRWIDAALDGSEPRKRLLIEVLYYVQGDDPPEPGRPFPYARMATACGYDEPTVIALTEDVLRRIGRARPGWADQHIYRPLSRQLPRHGDWAGDLDAPARVPASGRRRLVA